MRLPLALFFLLTFTTSAYAECAWVLWVAQNPPPGPNIPPSAWRPLEGHENKKTREQAMNRLGGPAKGDSYMMCLPDTIDPRGPKGK